MPFFRSDMSVSLRDFFSVMKVISLAFFAPAAVALVTADFGMAAGFAALGMLVYAAAAAGRRAVNVHKETEFRHAMVTVVMVWLATCLLGALPFHFYMGFSALDSTFESTSAWTTTGFTLMDHKSSAPAAILFWRSFMQWIGGIGLVVAILTGVISMGGSLYFAEARDERIRPNVVNTVRTLWWIYVLYTAIGSALFMAAGMPFFDSVNHSMTAISTGGMSVNDASMGYYDSVFVEIVAMLLMIAGSISFLSHYQLLRGNARKFFADFQLKMLIAVLALAFLLVVPWTSLRTGVFQAVSALTCSGLATADVSTWPVFPLLILVSLMLMGGSSGSTAGAMKLFRVGVILKSLYWNTRKLTAPHLVVPKKLGSWRFSDEDIRIILLFCAVYMAFIAIGTLVLVSQGYGLMPSFFETASAQGNAGLSMGIVNKDADFIVKIMLMANMLLGRLEVWAVLVTLGVAFGRK